MNTKLKFLSVLFFLFMGQFIFAQIKGTIVDQDGTPVDNVQVSVAGSNADPVLTDFDGKFEINAKVGDKLLIEGPNGSQSSVFVNKSVLDAFTLSTELTEVVAVGYGVKSKDELTGAISSVDKDVIKNSQYADVVKSLDGVVPGMQVVTGIGQPGSSSADILIRGLSTFYGSSSPLIIVNGVPYNGGLNTINSNNIENISVLKDASATAIYGNKAKNGVIIITTKQPVKGELMVEMDLRRGVNQRAKYNEYDVITSDKEFYSTAWTIMREQYLTNNASTDLVAAGNFASSNLIPILGYNSFIVGGDVNNNNIILPDGNFASNLTQRYHDSWDDALFTTGTVADYFVRASGGSENFQTSLMMDYYQDEGFTKNTYFNRLNTELASTYSPSENVKLDGSIQYTNMRGNTLGTSASSAYSNAFNWAQSIAPVYPVFARDINGDYIVDGLGNNLYDFGLLDDNDDGIINGPGDYYGVRTYGGLANPAFDVSVNQNRYDTDIIFAQGSAEFKFLKHFDFRYVLTGEVRESDSRTYQSANGGLAYQVDGRLNIGHSRNINLTNQQLLSYNRIFNTKHDLTVMVGHEDFKRTIYGNGMQAEGFYYGDVVPYVDFADFIQTGSSYENQINYRTESYFSRLDYSFNKKYILSGSYRTDGSSVFDPSERWGNFYSISGAWRLSQENFIADVKWIKELKISAGYGTQGSDYVPYGIGYGRNYYAYQNQNSFSRDVNGTLTSSVYSYAGINSISYDANGNPILGDSPLQWEKRAGMNLNLNFGLFQNRIIGEINYYDNKSTDLINFVTPFWGSLQQPITRGIAYNIGEISNKGVETMLQLGIVRNTNWDINFNVNATWNKNNIDKFDDYYDSKNLYYGYNNNFIVPGNEMNTWFMREYVGVDPATGNPLYNVYDEILNDEGEVIGLGALTGTTSVFSDATIVNTKKSIFPKVYGGFGLNIRYKSIDLGTQFSYSNGGYGRDDTYQGLMEFGDWGSNYHKDALNMWTHTNMGSGTPLINAANQLSSGTSTRFLIKRNYVALNNLTLGYTLPQIFTNNLGLKALRFYFTGQNLWLHSQRKGYDPRLTSNGTSEASIYPINTTYALGVNIKF